MDDSVRVDERVFSNGDVYKGDFKGVLPHGKGRYAWCGGSVYEGEWENGNMTGKGTVVWSSGTRYEGDVSGGYLHGCGTLVGIDGSVYTGFWRMNVRNGIGKKEYANSDIYEGMWKEGVPEGNGSYSWSNGNVYVGKFKGGKMCGRGVMKWVNGDLYSGSWLNGLIDGSGLYRFADGSYYFGSWTKGLKEGKGTYYPVGIKHPSLKKWCSLKFDDDGKSLSSCGSSFALDEFRAARSTISRSLSEHVPMDGLSFKSGGVIHRATSSDENSVILDSDREFSHQESSCACRVTGIANENKQENKDNNSIVFEREYMQGVLIREKIRNYAELLHKSHQKKKLCENEVNMRADDDISTSHRRYHLMLNLQLGIRYTVGKITPVPAREVRPSDFGDRARIRMYFPRKGSQFTPPHKSVDFHWKDYCPMVFRNLRELFKLDAAEFMMSICGDDGLKELSSPGKSGSIFYHSQDGKFVIKTLKKFELKVLLKMLQHYYDHVKKHDNTLITKFFGVHRIKLKGGKKVRFVVMGNMFCTELRIHRRYDLKGSSQGRFTDKDKINENTTLKDLDLTYEFQMDKLVRESLFKQLVLDCRFLESQQIIDYSLLLGLHFRAPEPLETHFHPRDTRPDEEIFSASNGATSREDLLISPKGLILVTHEPSASTTPGPHVRGNPLRAFSVGDKEVDLLLPGTGRLRVQLGVNMPAQASRKVMQDETGSTELELFEVYDVVLYMGIIDILQEYNLKKKAEHAYKSLRYDPLKISAVEPKLYARRFINFLEKVFPSLSNKDSSA